MIYTYYIIYIMEKVKGRDSTLHALLEKVKSGDSTLHALLEKVKSGALLPPLLH